MVTISSGANGAMEEVGSMESVTNASETRQVDPRPWDSSDPFFSAQTRDLISMVFRCYIQQVVIFVGIPGNIISALVFLKQGLLDRINLLLFWLALADLCNLVTQLLFKPGCYLSDPLQISNWETIRNSKIVYVNMWSSFVSGTLIVVMSVDRCLSVAMPLKARTLLTYRPMVLAILLSYLAPLACCLPSFFAFSVQWRTDPSTNRSIALMVDTEWFAVNARLAVLILDLLILIAKPIFFIVVTVCCIITIVHLRRASRKRMEMMENARADEDVGDNRITKMLLFLCVVYAGCVLPELCSALAYAFVPDYFLYKRLHNTFVVMNQMLVFTTSCLNSTANFFSYLLLSSRFRSTLKAACRS